MSLDGVVEGMKALWVFLSIVVSLDGVVEGVKVLWVFLSREIDYQRQLNPNMEALENRKRALLARNDRIVREVDCNKLQGRSALNEVSNWLQDVESVKGKVSDIQKNFEEEKKCWNFFNRRKISKESSILIGQVEKLITDCKFENGVTFEPPATNELPTMPIKGKTAELTLQEILDCILGTEKPIIGVHGMGGVGKTTIMKNIHNDLSQQSESKHFDCCIWITVSNEVDVNKLQRKIAKELNIDIKEDDDEGRRAKKIFDALKRRKKFLLILDDMWDSFRLDEVGIPLPSIKNGCKLVLTTRNLRICGQMEAHAIEVRVLSEEESWEFFKDTVAVAVGGVIFSEDIESLARDVAKECCNLPLAIKTVGGSMRDVNNAAVWKDALKDLKDANGEFEDIVDKVFTPLKFSYTQLRDTVLQSCFLFCSLYPEDHEISANELIDNWICEGLIDKRGTREDDINKGHSILDRLIKVSMLERCDDYHFDPRILVKMHDLVRDMAINITRAENPQSVIFAGRQLRDFSMELPEGAMRMSLMYNDINVLSGEPNCQHLLTFLIQYNPLRKISPDSYFNHMCSLRVLNLSGTRIKVLPESISNLKQLRALILTGCRTLKEVPSLEKLEELRLLDLNGTNIRELPSGVEAMVCLQRLDLDETRKLRVFPAGIIPRLSHLEELTMYRSRWKWSSKTGEGAGIEEILNSTRLAILEIQFEKVSDFIHHAKSKKWQMKKRFRLFVGTCQFPYPSDNTRKPVLSYRVEIGGCYLIGEENQLLLPDTAQWLVISDCRIRSLWHFTRLLHKSELYRCDIRLCKKMKYLMAEEEPLLPYIKELEISSIPELLVLCKGIPSPDALKSLESLKVHGCDKLKYLLPARLLQQLRCLKSIFVVRCNEMKEIVGEEEETREDDNNAMLILYQLQSLAITYLPELKGIFSGVLICNALETIRINDCPELKKLPFSVDNLPCALKEIEGEKEWWDAVEWDHEQTKAHFDSIPKMLWPRFGGIRTSSSDIDIDLEEVPSDIDIDLEEVPSQEKPEEVTVLDLNGANIRELPSKVGAMVNLQRLHLDNTGELHVFPAGIIPRLSHLEELTMGRSGWKWSSKAGEGAGIEEIMNSTGLAILNIQFKELSDFLQHAKSDKWQTMKRFCLAIGRSVLPNPLDQCSLVEIGGCDLIGEENQLLLPDTAQWLVISDCQISSLWHFTRLLHKSELYCCKIEGCKNMEYLMAEEEPLLPDIKELNIQHIPELLVLCKGIPSPDALKSLESLVVSGCGKLKYLLPARLLQQLRCLKSIFVSSCDQMKEIVGEEEEMGENNAMLRLSQLQSLEIINLQELKGICSRVLICNALESIEISDCPELKKLPFSADDLPCALKEIKGEKEWWDALKWDHEQTKAHFDSRPKKLWTRSQLPWDLHSHSDSDSDSDLDSDSDY